MRKRSGWRAAERTYKSLSRDLWEKAVQERLAPFKAAMCLGARELRAIHHAQHPTCLDQGPLSCPTWEAIYALERRA